MTYGGIAQGGFSINPVTGVITTSKPLDRESQDIYAMTGNYLSVLKHYR